MAADVCGAVELVGQACASRSMRSVNALPRYRRWDTLGRGEQRIRSAIRGAGTDRCDCQRGGGYLSVGDLGRLAGSDATALAESCVDITAGLSRS